MDTHCLRGVHVVIKHGEVPVHRGVDGLEADDVA